MRFVGKVPFCQPNDKRFYFSNGIVSLLYDHLYLENSRQEKQKYRAIHKVIQEKICEFLKQECRSLKSNEKFHILKQIFTQSSIFYILDSTIISITKGWKSTKEQILNGSWK